MKKFLVPVLVLGVLAGCKSTTLDPNKNYATGADQTVASFLADGTEDRYVARSVGVRRDVLGNSVVKLAPQQVVADISPRSGTTGRSITLTAFGRTVTFTDADLNAGSTQYSKVLPDGVTTVYFWVSRGTWTDVENGTGDYQFVVAFGTSDFRSDTQVNNRLLGVTGMYTTPQAVPTSGSARYNGRMAGEIHESSNGYTYRPIVGDVILDANFGAGQIGGRMTNIQIVNGSAIAEDYVIDVGSLEDGQFLTTLSMDAATCLGPCPIVISSAMNGALFGNSGQEAGGDFEMVVQAPVGGNEFYVVGTVVAGQ